MINGQQKIKVRKFRPCLWLLLLLMPLPGFCELSVAKYLQDKPASASENIFYPQFFRETDPITINNIFTEFKRRYEFFAGVSGESMQKACFEVQERANRMLQRLSTDDGFKFKWADNYLLFNEQSPLYAHRNRLLVKADESCEFVSLGDLKEGGGVFCVYHGPAPRSEIYQKYAHKFAAARPYVTAYDITEILIFLPFVMVLPISWLLMKKFLNVGQ